MGKKYLDLEGLKTLVDNNKGHKCPNKQFILISV